jgi:hypothetical protein
VNDLHRHSLIPNADDATTLRHDVRGPKSSSVTRLVATPAAGLVFIVSRGRVIGLDLLYSLAIITAPSALVFFLFR